MGRHERNRGPSSISVIGLGKLGFPFAVCWASRGFRVLGVDTNPQIVNALSEGRNPYHEPGLDKLLKKERGRICGTDDYAYATKHSDVTFIIVPTPSEADGSFSNRFVEDALKPIADSLREKDSFHLVTVTSTVLPGSMETNFKPLIEKISGKRCGTDFGLCYNPEFIALGDVVNGLLTPDFILIGESDTRSGSLLAKMYRRFCQNNPPISRMSLCNAELTKISLNVYVTMKMTFANTLAAICERIPGGNVDDVSNALGLDSRIGRKYLTGGLSYGGPCFPRDNRAYSYVTRQVGYQAKVSEVVDEVNKDQIDRVSQRVTDILGEPSASTISILGLTYKPKTNIIEESAALILVQSLLNRGAKVQVYDRLGMENARQILGDRAAYSPSAEECLKNADLCIIATPWEEFRNLKPSDFTNNMKHAVVLDCWRILDPSKFVGYPGLKYLAVGMNISANREPS